MDDVIRVSFKKKEKQLYDDILQECSIVGQSAWIKIAAMEKLQRDKSQIINSTVPITQSNISTNVIDTPPKQSNKMPIINTLEQLFKE